MRAMHNGADIPSRVRQYFDNCDVETLLSPGSVDLEDSALILGNIADLFDIDIENEQRWTEEEWIPIKRVIAYNLRVVAEVCDNETKRIRTAEWRF